MTFADLTTEDNKLLGAFLETSKHAPNPDELRYAVELLESLQTKCVAEYRAANMQRSEALRAAFAYCFNPISDAVWDLIKGLYLSPAEDVFAM